MDDVSACYPNKTGCTTTKVSWGSDKKDCSNYLADAVMLRVRLSVNQNEARCYGPMVHWTDGPTDVSSDLNIDGQTNIPMGRQTYVCIGFGVSRATKKL